VHEHRADPLSCRRAGSGQAICADTESGKACSGILQGPVHNDHTRKAYLNATKRFAAWCERKGLQELSSAHAFHVSAFIEYLAAAKPEGLALSKPTVKQHLAALRMLFDYLVTGHAVRGPKHVVKKGKTPVLNADEARALLDSIELVRKTKQEDGRRSSALATATVVA